MSRLGPGFDALSAGYDAGSWLFAAGAIRRSQELLLPVAMRDAVGPALVVGGGTGGVVTDLLRCGFPGAIVCLDVSERMLARTRCRVQRERPQDLGRVELRRQDVLDLQESGLYGLVLTHYVLDLLDEPGLRRATAALDRALRRDGRWSYVDFAQPSGGRLRAATQRVMLAALYALFRSTCGIPARRLPLVGDRLRGLGWCPMAEAGPASGWLEASVWRRR